MSYKVPFYDLNDNNWHQLSNHRAKRYKCGFCDEKISSEKGYNIGGNTDGSGRAIGFVYICTRCGGPTFFPPSGDQIPGPKIGNDVGFIPKPVKEIYNESRQCYSQNCFTASVMLSRKILMNIAVEQGAEENLSFFKYINYLSDKGFIPPNGGNWVDYIRKNGNEANHEIKSMNEDDAKKLIQFVELLLKFIFEFPQIIQSDQQEDAPNK